MRMYRSILTAAVVLAMACPATADMYRWVDENGISHYTDSPPTGVNATNMWTDEEVSPAAPPEPEAAAAPQETARPETIEVELQGPDDEKRKALLKKVDEFAKMQAINKLLNEQEAAATKLFSNRHAFRDNAQPLLRQHAKLNREVGLEKDPAKRNQLVKERQALWDKLFTPAYVLPKSHGQMNAYQDITRQLKAKQEE